MQKIRKFLHKPPINLLTIRGGYGILYAYGNRISVEFVLASRAKRRSSMKKRNWLLVVLTTLLAVCFAFALAACDKDNGKTNDDDANHTTTTDDDDDDVVESWKVTFKDGDTTVKEVSVTKGQKIAAGDIPADPANVPARHAFDGWFVGDVQVTADYTPTADVTATAKYHVTHYLVTFTNGEDEVSSVTVAVGEAVGADNIPADPADIPARHAFDGWFVDDETEVDGDYVPTADVVAAAKFHVTHYLVTFKVNGEEKKSVSVSVDGGYLGSSDFPSDPEVDDDHYFAGWFVQGTETQVKWSDFYGPDGDTVLEARIVEKYVITFKANGEVYETKKLGPGQSFSWDNFVDDPEPADEDHYFVGWFIENTDTEVDAYSRTTFTGDTTIVAKFAEYLTITFKNGDETVGTYKVEQGDSLGYSKFPEDEPKSKVVGEVFDKWVLESDGSTEVDKYYRFNESTTVVAKFVTGAVVTFKTGEEPYNTVTVKPGSKLSAEDFPETPVGTEKQVFENWVIENEDTVVDTNYTVNDSITVVPKFKELTLSATFKQDGKADKTVWYAEEGVGMLTEDRLPVPEADEAAGDFAGWYDDDFKPFNPEDVKSTYTAYFAKQENYTGVYFNDTDKLVVIFKDATKLAIRTSADSSYTYANGKVTVNFNSSTTWTLVYNSKTQKMLAICVETSTSIPNPGPTVTMYTLEKAEAYEYAGKTYLKTSKKMTIYDGGFVLTGSGDYYSRIVEEDGKQVFYYVSSASSQEKYEVTFGENYIIVTEPDKAYTYSSRRGLYVEGASDYFSYSGDTYDLYIHKVGDEKVYSMQWDEQNDYFIVTVSPEDSDKWVVDTVVTATKNDAPGTTYTFRITRKSSYGNIEIAGAEAGTYTGDGDNIVLDGFGKATVGGAAEQKDYYIYKNTLVIGGTDGYTLSGKTYTKLTATVTGDFVGKTFKEYNNSSYSAVFDPFGIVVFTYLGSSTYVYYAGYSVEGDTITLTDVPDEDYVHFVSGNVTFKHNQNVIEGNKGGAVYIVDGYTVPKNMDAYKGANNGYWKQEDGDKYIEITVGEDGTVSAVSMNGRSVYSYYITVAYDGSSISVYWSDEDYNYYNGTIVVLENGRLQLTFSEEGDDENTTVETYVSTAKPAAD